MGGVVDTVMVKTWFAFQEGGVHFETEKNKAEESARIGELFWKGLSKKQQFTIHTLECISEPSIRSNFVTTCLKTEGRALR